MEVRRKLRYRFYDLVMTETEARRHWKIMEALEKKHGDRISNMEHFGPYVRIPSNHKNFVFYLLEIACDEYEVKMGIKKC